MNKKNKLTTLFIAGLVGISLLIFACDEKKEIPPPDKVSLTISPLEIQGVLETSDAGLTLFDGEKNHLLKTELNLEEMLGEIVQVSGSLKRDAHGIFIQVDHAGLADPDIEEATVPEVNTNGEAGLARDQDTGIEAGLDDSDPTGTEESAGTGQANGSDRTGA
ncbi:hypothetical protein [Desulfospira joergensenii]|uniref:hypothetical protein n=1 Tax=Desulfospira joergensenii TaxID=53329 RepID=UPI0003B79514|nr:hypothetical protein [Desulfospira joergensenii]